MTTYFKTDKILWEQIDGDIFTTNPIIINKEFEAENYNELLSMLKDKFNEQVDELISKFNKTKTKACELNIHITFPYLGKN